MKAVLLVSSTIPAPLAFREHGIELACYPTVDALLREATRGDFNLFGLDLKIPGAAGALSRLDSSLQGQEPQPFVVLFNHDGSAPLDNVQLPLLTLLEAPSSASLTKAVEHVLPYLRVVRKQIAIRDENRALREELREQKEIARDRQAKVARLERRVFDFFTLSQVGKALASIQGLADLSRVFLSMVKEMYDSRNCCLLLFDEVRRAFVMQDCMGLAKDQIADLTLPMQEGLFWQLLNAGEPFPIVDSQGSYRFEQVVRRSRLHLLESELWVPLRVRNSLVGILTVGPKPDRQPYGSEERNYLSQLANQATVAFESARLNIQKELATKELAKKMESLSILYSVSKAMNFMNDLKRVLMLILDKAVEAVEAQKASLMLLNDDSQELVVHVVRGVPPDIERKINSGEIECARIKMGEGIAGRVASSRKPILLEDAKRSAEFADANKSYVENILCVPLIAGEECIGVINITNKRSGERFSQDDVDIMNTLAGQAAVTIHNAKLYHLAITDGMTQLHIHRYFQQRLKEEIIRASRFRHPVTLLMVDIDHFKTFNDTYGHQQGDVVLTAVARIIRTTAREVDIAARYGGEEFAVICPETTRDEGAVLAERLRRRIEDLAISGAAGPLKVTISIGVAAFPIDANEKESLIGAADKALYRAKEGGRNRVMTAGVEPVAIVIPTPAPSADVVDGEAVPDLDGTARVR